MKGHCVKHQQIGINNSELKEFNKITGYLTVSISVVGPGDETVKLEMGTDAEIAENKPLMPQSVKNIYKQMHFQYFKAEDLPIMDKRVMLPDGTIDAYIEMNHSGQSLKSDVIKMDKHNVVEWNQEMLIPIELPIKEDKISFKLFD